MYAKQIYTHEHSMYAHIHTWKHIGLYVYLLLHMDDIIFAVDAALASARCIWCK